MLLTDPVRMREHGNLVLRGECKGLLGTPEGVVEPGASDDASAPDSETQDLDRSSPVTKPLPAQRPSAFW
jgi:hypothetical protein